MSSVKWRPFCLCLNVLSLYGRQGPTYPTSWWRHQMETFSALLVLCAGNSPVPGEFPSQRPVMRSFDVFFDLRLNKRLSKQSWGWWFETLSRSLWRHCNVKNSMAADNLAIQEESRTSAAMVLTYLSWEYSGLSTRRIKWECLSGQQTH